jgi:hypothetical protein
MRMVLICHNSRLAHVVLHTLRANGIKPMLVCNSATASSLRVSRLISGIIFEGDLAQQSTEIAAVINQHHRYEAIELVLSSDVQGLYVLHNIRDCLIPTIYPMPSRATLDLLNDKWNFHRFASTLGLRVPRTLFFPDRSRIEVNRIAVEIGFPAVVKPTDAWAGIGFMIAASERDLARISSQTDYPAQSIVVQQFIPGRDIGLGLFARNGKTIAASTFLCGRRNATEFMEIPELVSMCDQIVHQTNYGGIANFDARLDHNGQSWLLECNPRCFMRLSACRICGLDLLKIGLPSGESFNRASAEGCFYSRSDLMTLQGIGRLLTNRWSMRVLMRSMREALDDPAPLILRRFGSDPSGFALSDSLQYDKNRRDNKNRRARGARVAS